jgi:signal recognition particle receptor subunit beta
MTNCKLIITGPVGAGKSTAIETLSNIATVRTDRLATDITSKRKAQTTIAMDYGVMKINETENIHLYGTPGQERFNFMWDILIENSIGLILLLDHTRQAAIHDMHFFLGSFRNFIDEKKLVIGVTHTDGKNATSINEYHDQLKSSGINPPIFEVDARSHIDMTTLVKALLYSIDPGIRAKV